MYLYCQYGDLPLHKTQLLSCLVGRLDLDGIKEQLSESLHVTEAVSCSLIRGFSRARLDVRYRDGRLFRSDPHVDTFLCSGGSVGAAEKVPGEYVLANGRDWLLERVRCKKYANWRRRSVSVTTLVDFCSSRRYRRSLLEGEELVKDNCVIWCLPNYIDFEKFDYEAAGRFLCFLSGRAVNKAFYTLRGRGGNLDERNARLLTSRSDEVSIYNGCCRFDLAGNVNEETVELLRNCELYLWRCNRFFSEPESYKALKEISGERLVSLFVESEEKVSALDNIRDAEELLRGLCGGSGETVYWVKHAKDSTTMPVKWEAERRAYVFESRGYFQTAKKFTFVIFKNSGWKFFFRLKSEPRGKISQPPRAPAPLTRSCCVECKIEAYTAAAGGEFSWVRQRKAEEEGEEEEEEKEEKEEEVGDLPGREADDSYRVVPCFSSSVRMVALCSNKVAEVKTTSRGFSFRSNYNKRFIRSIIRIEKPKCTVTNFLRKRPARDNIVYNVNYNGGALEKTSIIRQLVNFKNSCTGSVSPFHFHGFKVSNMNFTAYLHGVLNGDVVHSRFLKNTPVFNRQIRFHGLELKVPNSVFLFQSLSLCIPGSKGAEVCDSLSNFLDKAVRENKVAVNLDKNYILCRQELRNRTLLDKRLRLIIEIIYEVGRLFLSPQETANLVHLLANLDIRLKGAAEGKAPTQTLGTFRLHSYGGGKCVSLRRNWLSESSARGWKKWLEGISGSSSDDDDDDRLTD